VEFLDVFKKERWTGGITIGITTFERRFQTYFVPLVQQLRDIDADTEVVIAVNGEHDRRFSEPYRQAMLHFLADQTNIFPITFPQFRGLAKLWNSIIINASSDHILLLNDDVAITRKSFLDKVSTALARNQGRTFTINGSWSHFVVSRDEIDQLAYFDERLLGIGEEDGDMAWRYLERFGTPIADYSLSGISNFSEATMAQRPTNIASHSDSKYSRFNREFIYRTKYRKDPAGIKGMFDSPMAVDDPGQRQYPYERYFRDNRSRL